MSLELKTAPTDYPVTLEELKKQCEIASGITRHDDQLQLYLRAAVEYVEKTIGRDLVERTWYYRLDRWPGGNGDIELPRAPVISIDAITYTIQSASPTVAAVAASVYALDSGALPHIVYLNYGESWPAADGVRNGITIEFTTGHASGGDSDKAYNVPDDIKVAVLMVAADLFERREANLEMATYSNQAVEMLLFPNRVFEL